MRAGGTHGLVLSVTSSRSAARTLGDVRLGLDDAQVLRKGGSGPHQVLAIRHREVARRGVVGRITEPGLEHRLLLGAAALGLGAAGVEAARLLAG